MPLESMYLTPARLSRIFFLPAALRFLTASRRAILPSPIRTSPFMSRMVTSPACRSFTSSSAMVVLRSGDSVHQLCRALDRLLKTVERFWFGFVNVKDRQELGDRQQILKFLREVKKLQLSAVLIDRGVTGNEFADTAGIDIADAGKVQKNTLLAFFE